MTVICHSVRRRKRDAAASPFLPQQPDLDRKPTVNKRTVRGLDGDCIRFRSADSFRVTSRPTLATQRIANVRCHLSCDMVMTIGIPTEATAWHRLPSYAGAF